MKKDQLIGALIGVVRSTDTAPADENTFQIIVDGLSLESEDEEVIQAQYNKTMDEKFRLVPDCAVCKKPCGRTFNYDMEDLYQEANLELRQVKMDLLNDLIEVAKLQLPYSKELENYLYDGLFAIGDYFMVSQFEPFKERKENIQKKS